MSEPRIALVAEGKTDLIIIQAALRAILQRPFVLTQLQPEPTRPEMGEGWGGVYKWCKQFRERGAASIEADATLSQYDLVIVHLDADVADKRYMDYGQAFAEEAATFATLPCSLPCPPAADTVAAMETVLLSWLNIAATGAKSLFCIPSKASEAWLATAVLPAGHKLLAGIECNLGLEAALKILPKKQKIRKSSSVYQTLGGSVTARWPDITTLCTQAAEFERRIQSIAASFP